MDFENNIPKAEAEGEKEKKLAELRLEVDEKGDGLGKGIDEGIKDGVAVFMAYDFPTNDSCEGHIKDEVHKNLSYPRVGVYEPEPEGWEEDKKIQDQWREANLYQQRRMQILLDEFYEGRDNDAKYSLHIEPIGIFGGFRVVVDTEKADNLGTDEQIKILERARQEMSDFTNFLKDKFLKS